MIPSPVLKIFLEDRYYLPEEHILRYPFQIIKFPFFKLRTVHFSINYIPFFLLKVLLSLYLKLDNKDHNVTVSLDLFRRLNEII